MDILQTIQDEIDRIKQRNNKVEIDKAWETSTTRKICIALLTYVIISIFFRYAQVDKPLINAIVPTLWFLLSTTSLSLIKKQRIKYIYNKKTKN